MDIDEMNQAPQNLEIVLNNKYLLSTHCLWGTLTGTINVLA